MAIEITTELDFRVFMSANSPYMASQRGYCPLYITLDHEDSVEQIRVEDPNHVSP